MITRHITGKLMGASFLSTALVISLVSGMFTQTAQASGGLTFEEFATHPYASKTGWKKDQNGCTQDFCPNGQTIIDMGITDRGELFAGYGDWNGNVDSWGVSSGGIYAVGLKLSDGSWDMAHAVRAGSESLDTIREISGEIYASQTDPSNIPPTGYSKATAGIVTTRGGTAHFMATPVPGDPNLEHMFDVASLDGGVNDLWVFGSHCFEWWTGCNANEGVAIRSHDSGKSFEIVKQDNSGPGLANGYERAYWGIAVDGKVYMQSAGVNPGLPLHIYDSATDTWSDWGRPGETMCTTKGSLAVGFDHHLVCAWGANLTTFDGATKKSIAYASGASGVSDLYVARDGNLYVLDYNGMIYRTDSLERPFTVVGSTKGIAGTRSSIAVYDDYVYVGGAYGKIYRSTTKISQAPAVTPEISTSTKVNISLDTPRTSKATIYGNDFDSKAEVSIGETMMPTTVTSATQLSASIDNTKLVMPEDATSTDLTPTTKRLTGRLALAVTNGNGERTVLDDAVVLTQTITVAALPPIEEPQAPAIPEPSISSPTPAPTFVESIRREVSRVARRGLAATGDRTWATMGAAAVLIVVASAMLLIRRK